MELVGKNTWNEPINVPFSKLQRPQYLLRSGSRKKKAEIPKDELKDEDFDQIVLDTSRLVTMNTRVQQLNDHDTAQNNSQPASDKALESNETIRQSEGRSLNSDRPNETNESVLMDKKGNGASNRLNASQPKRPMNAFMVWGQAIRRELHNQFSNVQNAVLSKSLGRVWKRLELSEKEPYIARANIIKSNHKRDFPNYRYQPRRVQEKQRRLQETHNLEQQLQKKTRHVPKSSVLRRSIKLVNVITSAAKMLFEENVHEKVPNVVTPVLNNGSNHATMMADDNPDGEPWKRKVLHTASGGSGERDEAFGSVLNYGEPLAKKFPHDQEAKYYRFEPHNPQLNSEYHLPSIEFDQSDGLSCDKQTDRTFELHHQVPFDDSHHQHHNEQQQRLFYYNSAENSKQTDVQMMNQPVANNLCIDLQQHSNQSTVSINSYNSNYRQQYQRDEEEIMDQHQQQLAQQLDIDHFSQYRQAEDGYLQYYDAGGRYNQHNLDLHHHHHHHHHHQALQHQQQHLPFIRQMNEFAQTVDYGTYRVYGQSESYHTHRGHSDEICPV